MKSALTNALPSAQSDPVVGVPTHKAATAVGAVLGGAAAGAATGVVAGPVGAVIGAVAGAVAGGLGADAVADSIDETREAAHWKANYQTRAYVPRGASYEDFGPAYAFGIISYRRSSGRTFDEAESDLSRGWVAGRGGSTLTWELARPASREAWERVRAPYKITR